MKIIDKTKIYNYYRLIKDKIICIFYKYPNILDNYETIDKIINDRCSISRFGDGELDLLIKNKGFRFQKINNRLSERLEEVLKSDNDKLIIGIPKVFRKKDLDFRTEESKRWWNNYILNNRLNWYRYLDTSKVYGNTNFTRNYIAVKDKSKCNNYFNYVKRIWNNRNVIIVEGEFSRLGVGNDLFSNASSIERILAPNENAFDKYDNILKEIMKQSKEKLILLALGPTATILAYDLCKLGYQALDIGHIDIEYEWFLRKVDKKVPIENKYTFEAGNLIESDAFENKEYNEQIVSIVI